MLQYVKWIACYRMCDVGSVLQESCVTLSSSIRGAWSMYSPRSTSGRWARLVRLLTSCTRCCLTIRPIVPQPPSAWNTRGSTLEKQYSVVSDKTMFTTVKIIGITNCYRSLSCDGWDFKFLRPVTKLFNRIHLKTYFVYQVIALVSLSYMYSFTHVDSKITILPLVNQLKMYPLRAHSYGEWSEFHNQVTL